jgi:hypothetical protein
MTCGDRLAKCTEAKILACEKANVVEAKRDVKGKLRKLAGAYETHWENRIQSKHEYKEKWMLLGGSNG